MIPKFGMVGAGWATAISYGFLTAAYLWFGQRLIYLKIDWTKVTKMLILGFAFVLLMPLTWRFNFWPNFGLKVAEFAAFVVLLYLLGIIEKDELKSLKKLCLMILTKIKGLGKKSDNQSNIPPIQA